MSVSPTGPDPYPSDSIVRLEVNLAPDVAGALKAAAGQMEASVTLTIRHAIALLHVVRRELREGGVIVVRHGSGNTATYRDLELPF